MSNNVSGDIKKWPTLYKTSSAGKELQWDISVEPNGLNGGKTWNIITVHGQVDGAMQTSSVEIKQGKNLGRTNATTAKEQAVSEADSKWTKQHDKKYSEARGGGSKTHSPMLAETYEDHIDKVVFPCYIQPKLDGHRCIAKRHKDSVEMLTRNGKPFLGLEHIRQELMLSMYEGEVWDGEVYSHKKDTGLTFQDVTSLIKKPSTKSMLLKYYVYDRVTSHGFEQRFTTTIQRLQQLTLNYICVVHTAVVDSHERVISQRDYFESIGYEGAMLRTPHGLYKEGGRSKDLLKVKAWVDAEFLVIDIISGRGKMADKGIYVCQTADGTKFNATANGDDGFRQGLLSNKHQYIGKMLTVEFFEWTTSKKPVPRFPKGLRIREEIGQ
jgi:DNA ligase-1